MENAIIYSASIGSIVFLIQKTDFIFEYLSLAIYFFEKYFFKLTFIKKHLLIEEYKNLENPEDYSSYIEFFSAINGFAPGLRGFLCKLISCFICLSCFLTVPVGLVFIKPSLVFICFIISMIIYFILFNIQKAILYSGQSGDDD